MMLILLQKKYFCDIINMVIRMGRIDKINYYSYMSYAGYAEARSTVEHKQEDFFHNLAWNAQKAMKENALATLRVFSREV